MLVWRSRCLLYYQVIDTRYSFQSIALLLVSGYYYTMISSAPCQKKKRSLACRLAKMVNNRAKIQMTHAWMMAMSYSTCRSVEAQYEFTTIQDGDHKRSRRRTPILLFDVLIYNNHLVSRVNNPWFSFSRTEPSPSKREASSTSSWKRQDGEHGAWCMGTSPSI